MNKKKLCLIYNTAPRYREAIFRAIDEEYDCDWYFGPKHGDIKEMDMSKLKNVHRIRQFGNPNRILVKFGMLRLLFKKKYQTYFMLAETRSITDWLFFWLARTFFPKKKVYIWTHGWYGKESRVEAKMKLWLYRHVAGTFVYSNYARELLLEEGIPNDKLFTIHNSLHYDEQKKLRASIKPASIYFDHFKNSSPVLIMIGRLNMRKKLDMLIDAVSILKSRGESYNVVFIGDGEDRQKLEDIVKEKGLQTSTWFYGACYDERTNAELLYNADMCVVPGDVGLTAIHSMMFGVPVISHNCYKYQGPEFEAIHPGETGDFYEYQDEQSLVETISRWFNEKKGKRNEVREACFHEIDTQWNPYYQIEVINKHLR